MEADQSQALSPEIWLAVCALPTAVKARNEALDAAIVVLREITNAMADALPEESGLPTQLNARVLVAVHLVARVAVSLIEGARDLLPGNAYAASALVRQLVEVEYLAWACANDEAEAVDWLTSDREARRKRWAPQRLRDRAGGRFDAEDYRGHCEAGGHPTPAGILTLHGPTEANPELIAIPEATLYEVTLHAMAITDYISHAVPENLPAAQLVKRRAHEAAKGWRETDLAAQWSSAKDDPTRQGDLLLLYLDQLAESLEPE